MSGFMGFALGTLTGAVLGSIGMLLFLREMKMDLASEEDSIDLEKPWEAEELEMPKEVDYGNF